jgi:beta-lactamase regulating signal transducer with metallopeptidase domain
MEYLLKASAVVVLFYLCFSLFLKRETFFNHNRWFLFIGLLIALIFPLIVIPIYIPIEPTIAPEVTYIQTTSSNFAATATENPFDWTQLIQIIYAIGFTIFSIQFILQFGSLILLLLKNPKCKDAKFTYVIVKSKISPFSFFKWIVYNPDNFEDEELDLILTHEKVHANQLHSIDIVLTQLACVIFWFNPFIWFYRREVRQNLEYIADYQTQIETRSKKEYQRLLLRTSVSNHNTALSNHFYNSLIKERIIMLKKSRSHKKQQWKYLLILPLLAGLLMSMNTEDIYVTSKNNIKENNSFKVNSEINLDQRIEIVFINTMTDAQLDEIKNELESHGVTMTINNLRRNSKGEIKAIDIDFDTKNGSANYNVKSNKGIDPFYFNMSDDGSFGVGAQKETEIIIATPLNGNPSHKSERTFIFSQDDGIISEIIADSITTSNNGKTLVKRFFSPDSTTVFKSYRANFSNDSLYLFKDALIDSIVAKELSNLKTDYFYQNDEPVKIISESSTIYSPHIVKQTISKTHNDKVKYVIVLDGKIVKDNVLKTINPDSIESLTVLKGKAAIKLYGQEGENGVIQIKTKDAKSPKSSKSATTEKNPWSIRTEVTNVTFIDDEDASKNGMLGYITKYTTDQQLDKHKADLEAFDLKVKFSKIKRNKKGELTSIKISVKNEEGDESSASWKNDDGIPGIEFGKSEGSLVARTSTMN